MTWFRNYGFLILAAFPLAVYEAIALTTGWVPPITTDFRHTLKSHIFGGILTLGWAMLTLHFFVGWPNA